MSQLDQLAQKRDALLLAETGAWLHMLGKYDWQFIEKNCGGTTSYDYQNFLSAFDTKYPGLVGLLDTNSVQYQSVLSVLPITVPTSVGVFIRDHRETTEALQDKLDNQLAMLLVDAHGRGSNIDKSEIQSKSVFPGQSLPAVYLSSAFGFTQHLSAADYKTEDLHRALEDLIQRLSTSTNVDKWGHFVGELRQELLSRFQSVLAETRLPFNDVTLFDQSASAVAFFKAALAERVVKGNWKRLTLSSRNQYYWRTLSISIAGLSYLQNASGIADMLGRKAILASAQEAVRDLLEVIFPIGQEIYRDEQTSLFLVPDQSDLLQWQDASGQSLEKLIARTLSQATDGDIIPNLHNSLLEQGTRTLYTIGQQIAASVSEDVTSDANILTNAWQNISNRQICTVCGLRPQGPSRKASGRNLCDTCLKRRERRAEKWATDELDRTIWLDEVADDTGRLALVVGSWDLTEWLNGTLVNSIIAASNLDFQQLEADCRTSLQTTRSGNPQQFQGLLTSLLSNNVRQQFGNRFRDYFEAIIQPEWPDLTEGGLVEDTVAAIHFVRQNPSFARLRRIWETTRTFWQDVLPTDRHKDTDKNTDIAQSLVGQKIGSVGSRLQIVGQLTPSKTDDTPGLYHAYDLKLKNGVTVSVVWDPERKLFITCDNLDYLSKSALQGGAISDFLKGELTLEEPTGYGSQNKDWGKIQIESVVKMDGSSYTPAIPILSEPRTFLALLPAERVLAVVGAIRAKYEREMGKVRNRLPLHLGLVFFHRRTPLRTALDAGRRMLEYRAGAAQDALWAVQEVSDGGKEVAPACVSRGTKHFDETRAVKLEQNGRTLTWHVPAVMGDGKTPDNWYPYLFIQGDPRGRPRTFKGIRPTADGKGEECWLIHAGELQAGDQVYFTPATFDFEWLDSAGQRFAIAYDAQGRRQDSHTRPYLLDDLGTIEQVWNLISGKDGLSSSQIYALRDLIEAKRETWQTGETFTQLCNDAVDNAQWKKREAIDLCLITDAAVSGLLTDVIQLYMGILKTKPQREENENG